MRMVEKQKQRKLYIFMCVVTKMHDKIILLIVANKCNENLLQTSYTWERQQIETPFTEKLRTD